MVAEAVGVEGRSQWLIPQVAVSLWSGSSSDSLWLSSLWVSQLARYILEVAFVIAVFAVGDDLGIVTIDRS